MTGNLDKPFTVHGGLDPAELRSLEALGDVLCND